MRSILLTDDFAAADVKPDALLAQYVSLLEADIARFFPTSARVAVPCPGCGGTQVRPAFQRLGMEYGECAECRSLFVSSRPGADAVAAFYRDSAAEQFWRNELSRLTAVKRRQKIIGPRLDWVIDSTQEHLPAAARLADLGTSQAAMVEALASLDRFRRKTLVEPLVATGSPQVEVCDRPLTEMDAGSLDVLLLFEAVDRAASPDTLLQAANRALDKGGLCFITTILGSGFDLQVLWDRADGVLPPDRLNLLSVEGWESLLARNGFEVLEFSTPGMFDLDVVSRAAAADPALPLPRFVSTLLERRGPAERRSFQEFLQGALLSSYGRICARRR